MRNNNNNHLGKVAIVFMLTWTVAHSSCSTITTSTAVMYTWLSPTQYLANLTCGCTDGTCLSASWSCSISYSFPTMTTPTQMDVSPNSFSNSGSNTGYCQVVLNTIVYPSSNFNTQYVNVQILDYSSLPTISTYTSSLTISVSLYTTTSSTSTTTTSTSTSTSTTSSTSTSTSTSTTTSSSTSTSTSTTTFPTTTTATTWILTTAGIATLVVCSVIGVALLTVIIYFSVKRCQVDARYVEPDKRSPYANA